MIAINKPYLILPYLILFTAFADLDNSAERLAMIHNVQERWMAEPPQSSRRMLHICQQIPQELDMTQGYNTYVEGGHGSSFCSSNAWIIVPQRSNATYCMLSFEASCYACTTASPTYILTLKIKYNGVLLCSFTFVNANFGYSTGCSVNLCFSLSVR